ncbi:hypothetical protein COU62_00400 [Candidatus Pacearchaeota archaeon CG10_big_fil_rev_8_21_14_0_10_35_219]|nr:hypothetical protein [Candidatus Pacearchaeota archaeon]OIO42190.1 MAG: hypothetical protein AUJ63_02825 [Candidatus Pacearchaeota archaeon CG1_02_35_32]PIO08409.1 MAG: hypothetical protein COU62_00400 [Candidatus Pacearchaeota archaeon CG10_big_fil_rev_8_21_14_0_10_35_219]PIY81771.1 MAG: hypothetical protein COY79_00945 [Candidatus Pacearchaeota archaeon CG_4_10_14_0_8_um_filter_35_169]PIZ80851.1 MAG: hypothetical protein COY00_00365 [Candidatus Pacearchaeota archaeon CG_4_10_14_0_2_um_filt
MSKFLNPFSKNKIKEKQQLEITIDNRERNSLIPSYLKSLGFQIQFSQLPVADYIIKNTAIERKTISDFKSSIVNKRMINQLLELKQYPKHLLILEGINPNIYEGNIHENAFRGFLLSTALGYKTPIIFTLDEEDTAKYLYVLARKQKKPETSIRASKSSLSDKEQLQFILEGFPGIGPRTAKTLLKKYKTIKEIAQAPLKELQELIGKKAILLHKLFNLKF